MAAVEFLDIVIKARSQVTISADSSLNVSSLQERRNELKAEVAKQTADEMLYPISWG
jgi:cell division septum initiation protein DivIVA